MVWVELRARLRSSRRPRSNTRTLPAPRRLPRARFREWEKVGALAECEGAKKRYRRITVEITTASRIVSEPGYLFRVDRSAAN